MTRNDKVLQLCKVISEELDSNRLQKLIQELSYVLLTEDQRPQVTDGKATIPPAVKPLKAS